MIAILPLFLRFLPYLILVGALFGLYEYEQHRCNVACENQKELADSVSKEYAEYKAKEAQIVAGLASAWDQKRQEAEKSASEKETAIAQSFSVLQDRTRVAGADDHSYADGTVRLYDDARASAESAGTAGKSPEAAPAPSSSTKEYIVALYEWAAVCKARVDEWASFYQSLRPK